MTILCLDISSTATGYAVFEDSELVSFGVITPKDKSAPARIERIIHDLLCETRLWNLDAIYYERSDGKQHGAHRGRMVGLSVLGEAQGSVATALRMSGYEVHPVGTKEWTKGRKKETRARTVRMMFPVYFEWSANDKGLDVADAIGIGVYVLEQIKIKELMKA